jgi:hypothetical protein
MKNGKRHGFYLLLQIAALAPNKTCCLNGPNYVISWHRSWERFE